MNVTFLITLKQIVTMFFFLAVGFFMARKNFIPRESSKTLSKLGTYVFYPAYSIMNLSTNLSPQMLRGNADLLLRGLLYLAAVLAVAFVLSRVCKNTGVDKNALIYIFAFPNYGYFGYPVMEVVFGGEFVAKTILFALPMSLTIGTLGYTLLTGKNKSVLQMFVTPLTVALTIGAVIGLTGITLPPVVTGILTSAKNCMSPVTMLLTGVVLGRFELGQLFRSKTSYLVALIRLIALPVGCAALLWVCGVRGAAFAIPVTLCAMPMGLNTVLFTESSGLDSSENARVCFVSYVLGLLTIPLAFVLGGVAM